MSRGFIKEGDQEEIPMVPPRAFLPEGVPNYVTKEGLEALKEELKDLEEERTKAGDNYVIGNFIDAVSKQLIDRINSAVEIDLSKANKNTVSFGAWVRYNGRAVRIVGVDEADVNKGLISFISPLAKSLIGRKAGEVFELKGMGRIAVEEVSFEPMALTQLVGEKPTSTSLRERSDRSASLRDRSDRSASLRDRSDRSASLRGRDDRSASLRGRDDRSTSLRGRDDRSNPSLTNVDYFPNIPLNDEPNDEVVLSSKVEGPRQFEPEVNVMEFLPIVNERGNIAGRALYMELHKGNKMLHPVAHLHVINGKGETTRRYWWHVAFGDTPEKTLKRKMEETLGLSGIVPKLKRQYIREDKLEKELVYVFTIVSEENLPETPAGKDYSDLFAKD